MAHPTEEQVRQALAGVAYPGFSRDIVSFGLVKEIRAEGPDVHVVIEHSVSDDATVEKIRAMAQQALEDLVGSDHAHLEVRPKQAGPASPSPAAGADSPFAGRSNLLGVEKVIAVASAKGGVGKSTVATNLALALRNRGLRVGLMDADIYGPSLPTMLGILEQPEITDDRKVRPLEQDGLQLMSIGFLVPQERAMIWRGPMVMGAVQQFLKDVLWREREVLVVDLPPGTGDAQLTLVQQVPLAGVVMVTTPQEVALIDVVRGIQMFEETRVPVIGVVENMSGFVCPHCKEATDIFGRGGGQRTSDRFGVPFLGAVPLEASVVASGDAGRPIVVAHPESASARAFLDIAESVERFLKAREAEATR